MTILSSPYNPRRFFFPLNPTDTIDQFFPHFPTNERLTIACWFLSHCELIISYKRIHFHAIYTSSSHYQHHFAMLFAWKFIFLAVSSRIPMSALCCFIPSLSARCYVLCHVFFLCSMPSISLRSIHILSGGSVVALNAQSTLSTQRLIHQINELSTQSSINHLTSTAQLFTFNSNYSSLPRR